MARWLIIAGLVLVVLGTVSTLAPGLLGWFGKLPGDVDIETGKGRVFIPVTSMLVISVILTVLINIFKR